MKRDIDTLGRKEFDVAVIGGGAYGACVAWEAASRGLSVALVEKGDFCGATSANHLRMVHGGIRYLQHLDLARVRESSRERSALLRIAPHLVRPIPILMPTHGVGAEGRHLLRAGFALYDMVVPDRNRGIKDRSRHIPRGSIIGKDEFRKLLPDSDNGKFDSAGLFYDGQYLNPSRLALAFLQSAASAGAVVANYAEVDGFLYSRGRISGIIVTDTIGGEGFHIRSKIVVNAAGPWATSLLSKIPPMNQLQPPPFSRDAGFLVRGSLTGKYALASRIESKDPDAFLSRKGRHVFLVPWHGHTLVGVWHKVHLDGPEELTVSRSELQSFIDDVRMSDVGIDIQLNDISMIYSGLTLFAENDPSNNDLRFGHRSLLVDHAKSDQIDGMISLIGVRATTARGMAAKAVNLAARKIGKKILPSNTTETPLFGGDIEDMDTFCSEALLAHRHLYDDSVIQQLIQNHGSQYEAVLELGAMEGRSRSVVPDTDTLAAEIAYAIRHEMAQTLEDVVLRRTSIGITGNPGDKALNECAKLMGNTLGWDAERQHEEVALVRSKYPDFS
jgi:glycerol-3-phosphate dehydrogenase